MAAPEVVEKVPMRISEVRAELTAIKKRDGELNFRAQRALDYADEVGVIKQKTADDLFKRLMELDIPRFKDQYAQKLVDLLPISPKQVKLILQAYPLTITNENLSKIATTIKEFLPEKK